MVVPGLSWQALVRLALTLTVGLLVSLPPAALQASAASPGLLISELLPNPNGTDSPFEYVELIATRSINFATTPYSVVFSNNGTATAQGWIAGGAITYGFSITSGSVNAGDVVYVGGDGITQTNKLRVINTGTTAGDGFGNASTGPMGNGGGNADGVAVFEGAIASLTNSTVPDDAIFFGTGIGSALVGGGADGYQLPTNDRYSGGKLQASSFVAPDPGGDQVIVATGTYNPATNSFSVPRSWALGSISVNSSAVTLQTAPADAPIAPSCGASTLAVSAGFAASRQITAIDTDSVVSGTALLVAPTPVSGTITLSGVTPATSAGGTLTVTLNVSSDVPVGSYTATISFTNSTGQNASCAISVSVAAAGGTRIRDIQGAAHTSPLNGTAVSNVLGIVTAIRVSGSTRGFYLQDPTPDSNDATSEAIFVFTGSNSTPDSLVAVGDALTVSGTVSEFRPGGATGTGLTTSQIGSPTITKLSSGNPLPAPVVVGLGGRVPPTIVIDNDTITSSVEISTATTFDPAEDGIDFFESLEAMRVVVNNAAVVGPTSVFGSGSTLNREIALIADTAASLAAASKTIRGGAIISDAYANFNPQRIFLSDDLRSGDNANDPALPLVNVGAQFTSPITGVIDYSFSNFKLLNTQPTLPTLVTGTLTKESVNFQTRLNTMLSIATFNVENLDPKVENISLVSGQSASNVDDDIGVGKFSALAGVIVNNMRSPDIVALEEIQDNDGGEVSNSTAADLTYTTLISAIVTAGGPSYQFRQIDPLPNTNGGQPGGNIRVGFLFNPARVSFVDRPGGTATITTTVTAGTNGPELSVSPGLVEPLNSAFNDSRKPLVGEFLFNGRKVFVIGNHFSSKGADQPLFGRFQPPERSSETGRIEQARAVGRFVNSLLARDSRANIVVLGDINDFEFSPTTLEMERNGLTSLVKTLPKNERYTYVFQGNAQVLDQILVSNALLQATVGYDVVRVNAEFADQISDHDPQVARFSINPPELSAITTYNTGLGSANAEIVDVRGNIGILTNGTNNSVDILDMSSLPNIRRIQRVPMPTGLAGINSAAIHPTKDLFFTVSGNGGQVGALGMFRLSDGTFLVSATLGILPDSIDISPDGTFAVVANEAEGIEASGNTPSNNGGEGSLSVINLTAVTPTTPTTVTVTPIVLPAQTNTPGFSTGRFDDLARLPIDNTPATLEPETVTFSPDSQFAFVSLQENNGVVRLRLSDNSLTFFGLGSVNHLADLSTTDGYSPTGQLTTFREPDGIVVTPDGRYFVTADEGDTRPTAANAGIRGGRTVSIFDATTGAFIGGTGNQLDEAAAARGIYPDSRSNRGGVEPEVVDVAAFGGRVWAAVGLERANAVAIVDITTPTTPTVVQLLPVGAAPEGVKLVQQSGSLFVLTGNEGTGSLTAAAVTAGGRLALTQTYTENTPLALSDVTVVDPDLGNVMTVTLQLSTPTAGIIGGPTGAPTVTTSFDAARGLWSGTGPTNDLNNLLASLVFTPSLSTTTSLSITVSATDGPTAPVTGTLSLTGKSLRTSLFFPFLVR